jgi:hypothetical protein
MTAFLRLLAMSAAAGILLARAGPTAGEGEEAASG